MREHDLPPSVPTTPSGPGRDLPPDRTSRLTTVGPTDPDLGETGLPSPEPAPPKPGPGPDPVPPMPEPTPEPPTPERGPGPTVPPSPEPPDSAAGDGVPGPGWGQSGSASEGAQPAPTGPPGPGPDPGDPGYPLPPLQQTTRPAPGIQADVDAAGEPVHTYAYDPDTPLDQRLGAPRVPAQATAPLGDRRDHRPERDGR